MGCFGGHSDGGFGCEWLIILAILFFCFCNNGSGLSDLFDDCTLVWIAIILLLLFLCGSDNCSEDC